jgi:hypothetical protein
MNHIASQPVALSPITPYFCPTLCPSTAAITTQISSRPPVVDARSRCSRPRCALPYGSGRAWLTDPASRVRPRPCQRAGPRPHPTQLRVGRAPVGALPQLASERVPSQIRATATLRRPSGASQPELAEHWRTQASKRCKLTQNRGRPGPLGTREPHGSRHGARRCQLLAGGRKGVHVGNW